MSEENFNSLPQELISLFSHIEKRDSDEYETHKTDENYLKLKKAEKKVKKDLQTYLFNKRHKN